MSDLFDNIKQNIITNMTPLQKALTTQAHFFIDTFLEENNFSDEFEDDIDDNSDDNISNNYVNNNQNYNNYNNNKNIYGVPKQQSFKDNFNNLKINVYSPIICDNQIFDKEINIENNSEKNLMENNSENNLMENNSENNLMENNSENNLMVDNLIINDIKNKNNLSDENAESNYKTTDYIFNDELLIKNLITLSNIEKNQKLNIVYDIASNNKLNFQINIDESFFPQFSRWYYNQNRICTISTIHTLIDYTLEQYTHYKSINDEEYVNKYTQLLNNTKCGLLNLKFTYEPDNESSEKINKIINKITILFDEKHIVDTKKDVKHLQNETLL